LNLDTEILTDGIRTVPTLVLPFPSLNIQATYNSRCSLVACVCVCVCVCNVTSPSYSPLVQKVKTGVLQLQGRPSETRHFGGVRNSRLQQQRRVCISLRSPSNHCPLITPNAANMPRYDKTMRHAPQPCKGIFLTWEQRDNYRPGRPVRQQQLVSPTTALGSDPIHARERG
jgi:hypothetical protein